MRLKQEHICKEMIAEARRSGVPESNLKNAVKNGQEDPVFALYDQVVEA